MQRLTVNLITKSELYKAESAKQWLLRMHACGVTFMHLWPRLQHEPMDSTIGIQRIQYIIDNPFSNPVNKTIQLNSLRQ